MTYVIRLEDGHENMWELDPLYRRHYAEMKARLEAAGFAVSDYNPRRDAYCDAWRRGHLLNFVARLDGEPVGYSNVYLTSDMHNGDLIAQEDTIYVLPEHRKGLGRAMVREVLNTLRRAGVKRLGVTTMTDLRVSKMLERMGFRHVAHAMSYEFGG